LHREKNDQLNESVSAMQMRLIEAKHDMSRIQSSKDLLDQLKDVETERDVLVDFIQTDMKKSANISEKLEISESKLLSEQQLRSEMELKLQANETNLNECTMQLSKVQQEMQSLRQELDEKKHANHALEMQLDETKISLERKNIEADELFRMQTSLLSQVIESERLAECIGVV
jgi:hypothetical protein